MLKSPLDSKDIKPVNPQRNQPWNLLEGLMAEAEALILWPSDAKSRLYGKDHDAGKDWGQEEKEGTEDDLSFLNVEFQASFFTLLFHPHQETI